MEIAVGIIISLVVGLVAGTVITFLFLWARRSRLDAQAEDLATRETRLIESQKSIEQERKQLEEWGRSQRIENEDLKQRTVKWERQERDFAAKWVSYEEL